MRSIVMCGIPRTGSTLVYQIACCLISPDVHKTHPQNWSPDGVTTALITIRNPFDVAASLYRVRLSRANRIDGNRMDVDTTVLRARFYFLDVKKVMVGPHILLRYEDFWNNYNVIFDALEKFRGEVVPKDVRQRLSVEYSLQANRERASKLKNFLEVDADGIHGDHIGPAIPGSWQSVIPRWGHSFVKEICEPIAKKWGYVE